MGLICLLGQVLKGAGADTINLMLHVTPPPPPHSTPQDTGNMLLTNSYGKSLSAICFYTTVIISCNVIPLLLSVFCERIWILLVALMWPAGHNKLQ